MHKVIRIVDQEKRTVQVTTVSERWYAREKLDKKTGLPSFEYVPSVTWISGHYPKGLAFYKWLADKGWDESQAIKAAAGNKGSRVHRAITALLGGNAIVMDEKFLDEETGEMKELTLEEYECLLSFVAWHRAVNPVVKANEVAVWNEKYGYAGTVDLIAEIDGQDWIIDFKTSQNVWPEYELQVSAYKYAVTLEQEPKLAILQIGYRRNKNGYKWNEVEDKFSLFRAAMEIWKNECSGEKPLQKDYPLSLSLNGE